MKYIMGFDADTKKCGVAFLNTETGDYNARLIDYNTLVLKEMPLLLTKIDAKDLIVRIEMPTIQTAIGVNRNKTGVDKATGIYYSGQCTIIARLFNDYCIENGILTTIVKSQYRVRCDGKTYKNETAASIAKKSAALKKQGRFFSKLSYYKSLELFPTLKYINDEITDAILLLLPDMNFLR